MSINVVDLGKMQYGDALEIQEHLLARRQANEIGDTLLIVEHPPTLTLGTRGQYSNILASESQLAQNGIEVFEVNRGGDVTYHGPGQIVGYPIMNIACVENDIKRFIWNLEEVIIRILDAEYGITAMREDKAYTGVWVGDMKVCAIGIAVKKYVTMHGFALNANTNLEDFQLINPCGITDRGVTSIRELTGVEQNLMELKLKVANYFCQVFERNMKPAKLSDLLPD